MKWSFADGGGVAVSFSGHERNHLFLNAGGRRFRDVSGVSGLDASADSRGFVLFDYDRDGWQDIALVNTNAPLLDVFRNEIGESARAGAGNAIAVRFVGGNDSAYASEWSNRDGYGARVVVAAGGTEIVREHRCGEGFATQNSATLLIGIGRQAQADSVTVYWPSGQVQRIEGVAAGTLLTVYESGVDESGVLVAADDPDLPPGIRLEPYRRAPLATKSKPPEAPARTLAIGPEGVGGDARLRLYTTTATWCEACKKSLPQLHAIRAAFPPAGLAMLGVPVDEDDGAEKLAAYVEQYQPAYEILPPLSPADAAAVQSIVADALDGDVLPASIVTDGGGRILETLAGVPSISALRRHEAQLNASRAQRVSSYVRR